MLTKCNKAFPFLFTVTVSIWSVYKGLISFISKLILITHQSFIIASLDAAIKVNYNVHELPYISMS